MSYFIRFKSFVYPIIALFFFSSCNTKIKSQTSDEVLTQFIDLLSKSETIVYDAVTLDSAIRNGKLETSYQFKKVNYEPHLKLFFTKTMNGNTSIYYKLASLVVVEDQKSKITLFDYANDRSVPRYLDNYMSDDDNLIKLLELLNQYREHITFVENDNGNYKYQINNTVFWLNSADSSIKKLEVNKEGKISNVTFGNVQYNISLEDSDFTHPEKDGYVSSVFKAKNDLMTNTMAKEWTLKDLDDNEYSFEDYKGNYLFIESWMSSCHHCVESMPVVKDIVQQFGNKVEIVTVNFDYNAEETRQAISDHSINYKVLLGNAQFDKDYDIESFPSYVVIDKSGKIIFSEKGKIAGQKKERLFEVLQSLK